MLTFFDSLVRCETTLWNHLEVRLASAGAVSLGTLHALRAIEVHAGACRVEELRRAIGMTVGAASKVTDRLVRAGLVVRLANPSDGRSSLLELTPDGSRALRSGTEIVEAALGGVLANLDLTAAAGVLGTIVARIVDLSSEATS